MCCINVLSFRARAKAASTSLGYCRPLLYILGRCDYAATVAASLISNSGCCNHTHSVFLARQHRHPEYYNLYDVDGCDWLKFAFSLQRLHLLNIQGAIIFATDYRSDRSDSRGDQLWYPLQQLHCGFTVKQEKCNKRRQ